jgi:hypothetical protein
LEFRTLESVTPEKLKDASLLDLAKCSHILNKAEAAIKGNDSFNIKGLVDYLLELERLEIARSLAAT